MNRQFLDLVENTNRKLKEEEEVVELSVEEQKQYFKGWLIAKAAEDPAYTSNNIEDIADDFKDDATPVFGEDVINLEPAEFADEIQELSDKLNTSDEEGEEGLAEPAPEGEEDTDPVGDEAGEPVEEPVDEPAEDAPAEEGLENPALSPTEEEEEPLREIDY